MDEVKFPLVSWRTILYMVFICIILVFMDVILRKVRKVRKSILVEKIIACPVIQKVLFKTQNYQNWPHEFFFVLKILQSWCCQSWRFFCQKVFFLLIGYQSSPKKPIIQPAESHRDLGLYIYYVILISVFLRTPPELDGVGPIYNRPSTD